ncbi:RloB domain-containing protein [Trinickia dinghuensis]|uniref:RloB domain-containing protein n=1 Tax=Trinickia dinghuensis TaxID=2291023 RepID=A0A3D8JXA9_9BURK|nr:RloB domain-containing protein [Trinickia dinghuensis]RDU97276.1 RloB domain-containing protein [Trinickia dinghuensis]
MAKKRGFREEYETLLLVGEGETEVAFLSHIKALYVERGCGLAVKVICARGKGAAHVVDVAIRQRLNAAYDTVAVLLDTDTDWGPAVAKRANEHRIQVLRSEPMFEAMMLRVHRQSAEGRADELKRRFAPLVNGDGLDPRNYSTNFGDDILQMARQRELTLDHLLRLLRR